jgi:hypothetical protein
MPEVTKEQCLLLQRYSGSGLRDRDDQVIAIDLISAGAKGAGVDAALPG